MATISSPGVGSNLDVAGIVSKLMQVESQPLTQLQTKEASFQAKLTAYGTIKGALSSLQNSLTPLTLPSTFQSLAANSSDSSVVTASASSSAVAGTYSVTVDKLAQAQSISSAGQASTTATIGTGAATTLTFQFGTISGGTLASGAYTGASFTPDAGQPTTTVVIDSTNNSLQGMRDAINKANLGVTASIVNDGDPNNPYHLVLTSNSTGQTKSMKITASGGGDAAVTSLLSYDAAATQNLTQLTAAQNASLSVNGLQVTSASNTVTDAISGVTLNLTKGGGASASISLANNTAAVSSALTAFVKAYNDANTMISTFTSYNATTKTAGLLLGDSAAQGIQTRMRGILATTLSGLGNNKITNLMQIGFAFQKDGSLTLDSTKLQTALSSNFGDFAQLFASVGKTTDSLTNYAASSVNTQPGSYAINVNSLATQGKLTGSDQATQARLTGSAAAALTIAAGTNDSLTLDVDGATVTATLTAGTYTADTLAAEVQTQINNALATASSPSSVTVTQNAGKLAILSNTYGSASNVGSVSGNAASDLLGATPVSDRVTTIKAGVNDQLNLSVDGIGTTVTIAAGAYTAASLATQLQSAINGSTTLSAAHSSVRVTQSGEVLSIVSDAYGSTSKVAVTGGSALANLFGSAPTSTDGADVAGTLNGVAARGSGQSLIGTTGLQGKSVGADSATQAQRTGISAAGLNITAGVNDTIKLAIDGGATVTATLTAGSYTADTLATEMQTQINSALGAAGQSVSVMVTQNGGIMSVTSNAFGSASNVSGVSGNGAVNLFGASQLNSAVTTITAGVNDKLALSIDGVATTVTIPAGAYTPADFASKLQTVINGDATLSGARKSVSVTMTGGILSLTSNSSGNDSTVTVSGGSAKQNLFGSAPLETVGNATSNPAGDLAVDVLGGSTGARGAINYSQGFAFNFNKALNDFLSGTGVIASSTENANKSIADLQKQADALNVRLTAMEARYRAQFTALDTLIGSMNATSSFLTQQLSALSKSTSS